ncbi:MAG: hypothetical protein KBS52_05540 [Clostridiales bacterium]|nr:hypothetical protein [Candidatus Equinaster intestinalis]
MEQLKMKHSSLWWAAVILTVFLAFLFVVETPLSAYAATETGKYVKEVIMITASSLSDAQSKLKGINDDEKNAKDRQSKTYYLFDDPIYKCDGLETYLAYTTTDKKANAIRSIKAMNMTGGWSYEEYDKFLATKKDETKLIAEDLYNAVREYAVVVKNADNANAQYAKSMLEYFYEDDSGKNVSDFFIFLASMGTYDRAKEPLITFLMQANMQILSTVESALMIACADAYVGAKSEGDINFLTGIQTEMFRSGMPGYKTGLAYAEYDMYVQDILNSLPALQLDINNYRYGGHMYTGAMEEMAAMQEEQIYSELPADPTPEEYLAKKEEVRRLAADDSNPYGLPEDQVEAAKQLVAFENYYAELSMEEQSAYTSGKLFYDALSSCEYLGYPVGNGYEYSSLLDLVMLHSKMEDYKNEDFYPIINKLTKGQRALLKVGFPQLLSSVITPKTIMESSLTGVLDAVNAKAETESEIIHKGDVVSVYNGVDRSLFKPNSGIALTSVAIQAKFEKPFTHIETTSEKVERICSIIILAAGGVAAASLLTMTGFAAVAYFSFQAQFAAAATEMITVATRNMFTYSTGWVLEFLGQSISTDIAFERGVGWTVTQTMNGITTVTSRGATATATTFSRCFMTFLGSSFGTFLNWVNIAAIGVMIIVFAISILWPMIADEGDTAYVNIPRVMCAYQPIYGQKVEEGKDAVEDYMYYYGVVNPLLNSDDQKRAATTEKNATDGDLNILNHKIGDVCNWTLKGISRQWVALYTSTDEKSGDPILANTFKVLTSSGSLNGDSDLTPVVKFNETTTFDFHQAYGAATNKNVDSRYLAYKMEKTTATQSGSVFSDFTLWGGIIAGLVLGGGAGALVTYGVIRKRKKETANA